MVQQTTLTIQTRGRGTYEITDRVQRALSDTGVSNGLCNLFVAHTSASLTLCENADPGVRRDLETFFGRLVPDGDPNFEHTTEGPDDMAAHVRTTLTHSDVTVPVSGGRLVLGTWQGVYLWEHRQIPHRRRIVVTVIS